MTDALRLGRRAFTIAVVGATIAWSIGLATVMAPLVAHGAAAGDLIKGSLPAVYYYGGDGKRYVFPNEKTFKTWYADFSSVQTLSDNEIAAIGIGGNVVYRGGTRLIKIQTDPRVYALEPSGVIRWVESEAVASALYGALWASRVDDVPDVFFVDYTPGASLASAASYPAGSLVSPADSDSVYYIVGDGSKRLVDAAGMSANRYMSGNVVETSQNLSAYSDGAALGGLDAALADASQKGGVSAPSSGTPAGGLTISLASDTPASVTLATGSSAAKLLALDLTASGGDVTLSALTIKRFGVGAAGDWANLYLFMDGERKTDGRTVNATTHEASFSGLSLAIPSGTTKKLWLRGDVAAAAGQGSHGFQVASASVVTSTASAVNGSFPVSGNQVTIGSTAAGTITVDATGTIPNPTLGTVGAEIARFTLAAATEDATIQAIRFRLDGTVRGADLTNFKLKQGNTVIGEVAAASSDGRYVSFAGLNHSLLNGFTLTYTLHADIGGESARTIGVRVERAVDLESTGASFNQGLRVVVDLMDGGTAGDGTRAACAAVGQDCSFSTIQAADLTITTSGPSATDISSNSQDNVFLKLKLVAKQYVRIDELGVRVNCVTNNCDQDADDGGLIRGTAEANLKDIKISRVNGATIMGPLELTLTNAGTNDDVQTLTFTEDVILQAGESIDVQVTADVDNNATAADDFNMILVVSTIVAEDINGDAIVNATNIVPSADITGQAMTVRTAGLTVTHSVPPSDGIGQTTIRGTSGKDSAGFAFAAARGSDITVTSITLSTYVDGDLATDATDFLEGTDTGDADAVVGRNLVSSVSLYDGDTGALVAGPETLRATPDGNVVFDNFNWVVTNGQTKKLIARANIARYTVAGENDAYAFRIDAAADITAQDKDGATATVTVAGGGINGTATTPATFIQIALAGTLAASLHADTARADLVLAGATNVDMAKFRFDATNEGFKIDRFRIQEVGATNNGGAAGDNDNNIISLSVSYPKEDGSTGTATAPLVSGNVDFALSVGQEFYVPRNGNATLSVKASFQTVDNGATRGEKPQFEFDSTNAADFQAVGVSSGDTLTGANVGDSAANRMVLRETTPTLSVATGSPTSHAGGRAEALRFTVAAAAGEAVVIDVLTFRMTSSDNNGDSGTAGIADEWNVCDATADDETQQQVSTASFTVYETVDGPSVPLEGSNADWALLTSTGAACVDDASRVGFARVNLTTPEVIAAGTTRTYSFEADITGASAANDDNAQFEVPSDLVAAAFLSGADAGGTSNPDEVEGAVLVAATAVPFDDGDDGTPAQTNIAAGDYICFDESNDNVCDATEEIAFVTAVANVGAATGSLTVYRGDFGRAAQAIDDNANLLRLPSSLVWDDDGDSSTVNPVSSYRVKNLGSVVGSNFVF